jgi:hypothetical protein
LDSGYGTLILGAFYLRVFDIAEMLLINMYLLSKGILLAVVSNFICTYKKIKNNQRNMSKIKVVKLS